MQTVTLQHTELTVSRVCFGTMTFGGQADEAASCRMVARCVDAGINFFDTANMYNQGASEVILGKALKGKREKLIVASKVRARMGDAPDEVGLSRKAMLRAVEDTLRRLGTDYLDLYYLHLPDYDVPIEETLETMDQLVREGKVRYPATSNYAAWQMCQMLWIAGKNGYKPAWIAQPMYNLLARGIEQEYLPMTREFGISNIVYNPLAGGLLTGKQRTGAPLAGTRFDQNQTYLDRYWHPAYFEAVEELKGIANRTGRSLVSLSLNWLMHHTAITCVILGASKLEHLDQNLKALDEGPLPQEALDGCDAVWAKLRGITPKYNR
jgi:1-deoxyxylulose-5-phosphate synthase